MEGSTGRRGGNRSYVPYRFKTSILGSGPGAVRVKRKKAQRENYGNYLAHFKVDWIFYIFIMTGGTRAREDHLQIH